MIPKIIHQTAPTADLSRASRRYQQRVRDLHPEWDYRFWTDADNDAFVRSEYPDFYPIFAGYPKGIMRADVIRYLLMDRLGGLYLDLDYEILRPFDLLHHDCVVPWETGGEVGPGKDTLGNALFAATPGHFFFRRVIDALRDRPDVAADADVLAATGPAFITNVYRGLSPDDQAKVTTPSRVFFNPPSPQNPREYRAIVGDASVYGIHHCHGTWLSPSRRLHRWASRLYRRFL